MKRNLCLEAPSAVTGHGVEQIGITLAELAPRATRVGTSGLAHFAKGFLDF